MSNLVDHQIPKEYIQTSIENIVIDLNQADETQRNEEISNKISKTLLAIQKIIFKNKSMHFISEDYELLEYIENQPALGILIAIEDEFFSTVT